MDDDRKAVHEIGVVVLFHHNRVLYEDCIAAVVEWRDAVNASLAAANDEGFMTDLQVVPVGGDVILGVIGKKRW